MNYFQKGGKNETLTSADLKEGLYTALDKLGKTPVGLFRGHDWREGIVTLGEVPGELIVLAPGLAEFGEDKEIYYISNPGMGLWSWKQRFHSPGFPTTSS